MRGGFRQRKNLEKKSIRDLQCQKKGEDAPAPHAAPSIPVRDNLMETDLNIYSIYLYTSTIKGVPIRFLNPRVQKGFQFDTRTDHHVYIMMFEPISVLAPH